MNEETEQDTRPGIPLLTIARIFENLSFKSKDTKITANTLKLSSEYIRLFINEALIRSNEERLLEGNAVDKVDGIDNLDDDLDDANAEVEVPPTAEFDEDEDEDIDNQIPGEMTQGDRLNNDGQQDNQMLDTRHLSKIAGVLVLDF